MAQKTNTGPKIRYRGSKITKIRQIQYRAPRRQEQARSYVAKDQSFQGSKAKQGAAEGRITTTVKKMQNSSKKFIT